MKNLKNKKVAKELSALTTKMHGVEISCNDYDDLVVFGKIEKVQIVVRELSTVLSVIKNDIPKPGSPYYDGYMVAIVGKRNYYPTHDEQCNYMTDWANEQVMESEN